MVVIEFFATTDSDSIRSYMPRGVSYLLPASSWARPLARKDPEAFHPDGIPPVDGLPSHVQRVAADCGGFVATFKWGAYPYLASQYVGWCETIGPSLAWAAMIDLCCEEELTNGAAAGTLSLYQRQQETTRLAMLFWEEYMSVPWAWVPTLQGWCIQDYVRHAEAMAPLIREMQRYYYERPGIEADDDRDSGYPGYQTRIERNASDFRVGIGTLCRRASPDLIRKIVSAVSDVLPGVPLHLWGVKLAGLSGSDLPDSVVSVDSAAWNQRFGSSIQDQEREKVAMYRATGHLMTQREYGYRVTLPRYLDRFQQQINGRRHGRIVSKARGTRAG
jgi:hypothetical protein